MYKEKPASLWEASDVSNYVGSDEGTYLEFKKPSEFIINKQFSKDRFVTEIAESVSAFLNSDGGTILIGVQTDKDSQDRKMETLKPLEQWAADQTFEHLGISLKTSQVQDSIYGNLIPMPIGVGVKALDIPIRGSKTTIFVVTVPKSVLGAHQSAKTRHYYRRAGEGDRPMYDFEIKDVNSRRTGPLLFLNCRALNQDQVDAPAEEAWKKSSVKLSITRAGEASYYRAKILFAISNIGRGTANIARFDIGIPNPWKPYNCATEITGKHFQNYSTAQDDSNYLLGNQVTVFWKPEKCSELSPLYRVKKVAEQRIVWLQFIYRGIESPNYPIWPNAGRVIIGTLGLQRPYREGPNIGRWLPWRALSDEMLETRGVIRLEDDTYNLTVFNHEMDEVRWWGKAENNQAFEELKQSFGV